VKSGYELITDERELPARIARLSARTVVVDIEPLVAHWRSTQRTLDEGVAAMLGQIQAVPGVRVVCFATNSARRPSVLPGSPAASVEYLVSARKPLRIAPYSRLPRPGVVIGDQVATDGVLAWRLGYAFLHYRPQPGGGTPLGPLLLSRCGELLRPLLFSPHGVSQHGR
jgi:predicted HAD superfamily phosphohydrolase YqeG